jgi:hypothetical protein
MQDRFVRIASLVSLVGPIGCGILWWGVRTHSGNPSLLTGLIGNAFVDLIAGVLLSTLALMRSRKEGVSASLRALALVGLVSNLGLFGGLFAIAMKQPPMGLSGQTSIFYTPTGPDAH